MSVRGRLTALARAVAARTAQAAAANRFGVVILVPVDRAGGRPLGLHRSGPPGSTAGALVYDPAAGEPEGPPGALVIGGEALDEL